MKIMRLVFASLLSMQLLSVAFASDPFHDQSTNWREAAPIGSTESNTSANGSIEGFKDRGTYWIDTAPAGSDEFSDEPSESIDAAPSRFNG
jgi:hypothetical protein